MKKIFSLLASFILLASACTTEVAQNDKVEQAIKPLKIVTTIAPLYSLTANLLEGIYGVELTNIVPLNTSIHSYALTLETAKKISEADVIIINGLELEEFIEDTLHDSKALIVDTSVGVELKKFEEDGHGEYDPHIWLSPVNAKIQAKNIAAALEKVNEANAARYKTNLIILEKQLDNLNQEVKDEIAKLEVKPYIVFHDAYHYFEDNFGIHAVAFLEEFAGKEPTAEYLAEVIDIIEDNKVKVIFTEPQFSPKLVQTLSNDYDLSVGELDPLGQSISKDSYFELIRANLESLQKAFNQK